MTSLSVVLTFPKCWEITGKPALVLKLQDSGDISSSGSTLSPDESENEEEGDPPPSQASTVKGVAVFSCHQNFAR